jgi:hypothetical protein
MMDIDRIDMQMAIDMHMHVYYRSTYVHGMDVMPCCTRTMVGSQSVFYRVAILVLTAFTLNQLELTQVLLSL